MLLSRILGKGSYETVYQAQHKTTKQLCAVKHITFPDDAAQFAKIEQAAEREWMILQKVSHTNIVQYYYIEMFSSSWLIFLEYCES